MDTFENESFETEAMQDIPGQEGFSHDHYAPETPPQQPQSAPYRESASSYRQSPYANSPYARSPHSADPRQDQYSYGSYYQPSVKPNKEKKSGHSFWRSALAFVLTAALVAGGCMVTAVSVNSKWEARNQQTVDQLNQKIDALQKQLNIVENRSGGASVSGSPVAVDGSLTPGQVYAQNVDSVVAVSSTVRSTSFYCQTTEGTATGSGFILTEDGYVVTNYHVVEGAAAVSIVTHTGDEYTATVIGKDSANDVAVLKVEAEGLPAVTLGSSDNLIIGDMVVAIGNPLGELTATQTVGYVSGKNREVSTDSTIINMIQTDAAINAGNSGGPLFNMKGEVVGITTAKYSGTTNSGASIEGIGFAIPIDDVMKIIGDLKDYGYITGAYLGITVQNTDAASASLFGLPTGAYVVTVEKGYCAEKAGIQPKDIIIRLGEYDVSNYTELTRALRHFQAGETTQITVIRGGQQLQLTITLDERPQNLNSSAAPNASEMPSEGSYDEWFDYFRKYFGENGNG